MDHQAEPGEKLPENPERIWLAPRCNIDERTWCEDDIGSCDECGEPTVEYVRLDVAIAGGYILTPKGQADERRSD